MTETGQPIRGGGKAPAAEAEDKPRAPLWRRALANVTVEPLVAGYVMPSVLASLATQNLNLQKACSVNLAFNDTVCDALALKESGAYQEQEAAVQQLVTAVLAWRAVLQASLPAAALLFLGAWSDRHGRRKPLMLTPVFGELAGALLLMLCVYCRSWPVEAAALAEALPPALTGGWVTAFMAIFSYMGDVTTPEERTLRIGVVNVCLMLGVPIGMALSGVLLRAIGFYGVFLTSACIYTSSITYGFFFIHDKPRDTPAAADEKPEKQQQQQTAPQKSPPLRRCMAGISDLLDVRHVARTFRVAFRHGNKERRMRVAMLMLCCCVIIGPMHGEMAVLYLFTRYRFNWNEVDFSIFSTYSMITNLIGTMVSVGVFSHVMKMDDALVGVLSCTSKIISSFVYAFSYTTWMIYMAPIAEILNGTSFIAMRSIMSKLVPPDELGQVNSLFGVCEALMPLVYAPLYTSVYAATMDSLPGAFFLLGGGLTMPAVAIFLWLYASHKKDARKKDEEENVAARTTAVLEAAATATKTDPLAFPMVRNGSVRFSDKSKEGSKAVDASTLDQRAAEEGLTHRKIFGVENPAYEQDSDTKPGEARL
ncbi:solute carrier family 46 member 3-like [Schistocerca cancellata]|uniref:solute carrier family 46 member 3-like n=1 Tax=Schistocerca cancellata TaxID=274614 RepID=UPI0021180B64|nr:solute carrier family 46 member 3-like [Schistocerca cancellata]